MGDKAYIRAELAAELEADVALRDAARDHWEYTRKVLKAMSGVAECLYVEAFIHGAKHGRAQIEKERERRAE